VPSPWHHVAKVSCIPGCGFESQMNIVDYIHAADI
jgi:hypothetical protein